MKRRLLGLGAGAATLLTLAAASEVRVRRAERPLTERWRHVPVERSPSTLLGVSFRPLQAEALRLEAQATLRSLLALPFQVIRLGAYWSRVEPAPGEFRPEELDSQVELAEAAGKKVILCVGAVKMFGYPEFFVPPHHVRSPLHEGALVEPADHPSLLAAATRFVTRIVERYRGRKAVIAWQVEHEAVDPLGMEHSWRLSRAFVQSEVEAARKADPTRPILMNGFLPTSLPVRLHQWWRTRDQGDSISAAQRLADIVGVDYYPRHALAAAGTWTVYLDGGRSPWRRRSGQLLIGERTRARRLMISEGQAEPWEAVTTPPSPQGLAMYSCPPERVIENYNQSVRWARDGGVHLHAYLFWGAEYWVLRQNQGDGRYLQAFARVLQNA